MISKNKMVALIMIGGQSKRMGGGVKSFIEFNKKKIFDRIIERSKPQIEKIIINCNTNENELKKYDLPIIQDIQKGYLGPLAGIHSGLNWIKNNDNQAEWLITLPGDTPFIPLDLISRFEKKISSKLKIILVKSQNRTHPIIGAWHISLFDNLKFALDTGTRKILSWAELHPIDYINYDFNTYDPFFNINKREDIDIAIKIEKNFI